jgi:hypothetical protein
MNLGGGVQTEAPEERGGQVGWSYRVGHRVGSHAIARAVDLPLIDAAPDEWVAYEYAKVRRLYDQLGLGDRTEIEFFNGPHTINGVGTFEFLHRQLRWPKP